MTLKHHRITVLALALVVAAIMASSASARPIDQVSPQTQAAQSSTPTSSPQATPEIPNAILNGAHDPAPPSAPHGVGYSSYDVGKRYTPPSDVPAAPVASNPGFDWGDAGIGAGAALALTMIGLGGLLVSPTAATAPSSPRRLPKRPPGTQRQRGGLPREVAPGAASRSTTICV